MGFAAERPSFSAPRAGTRGPKDFSPLQSARGKVQKVRRGTLSGPPPPFPALLCGPRARRARRSRAVGGPKAAKPHLGKAQRRPEEPGLARKGQRSMGQSRGMSFLRVPCCAGRRGEARAFRRKPHGQSLRRNARKPLVPSFPRPGPIRHLNNFGRRCVPVFLEPLMLAPGQAPPQAGAG